MELIERLDDREEADLIESLIVHDYNTSLLGSGPELNDLLT